MKTPYKLLITLLSFAVPKVIAQYKNTGGSVKLTFDESGKLESYTVYCSSDEIKKEFNRTLAKHPKVKPGTMNGKPSKLTYLIPFTLHE